MKSPWTTVKHNWSSTERSLGWGLVAGALLLALLAAGCAGERPLRLATTTSTEDSGLLEAILPEFLAEVDVIAVGTGQALALGERGDVDVVLVHAPELEKAFVEAGHGTARFPVMANDFVLLGPEGDPVQVRGVESAAKALARIAQAGAAFASRGDRSGTHAKELQLWEVAGLSPGPEWGWYFSLGQGMGATLQFAAEQGAYALSDRGTYLAMSEVLGGIQIVVGGATGADNPDPLLANPYNVIPVNPERHPGVNAELTQRFVDWLISLETQRLIGQFGVERYGQPLFVPARAAEGSR